MNVKKNLRSTLTFVTILTLAVLVCANPLHAGSLQPPGAPAPTMKTLNQVPPTWSQTLPANDGTSCNSSRFECVLGGNAVLDKETGLVWAKNANQSGGQPWITIAEWCATTSIGGRRGWRLPTVAELTSLIGSGLPAGHPFQYYTDGQNYWTLTSKYSDANYAYQVSVSNGSVLAVSKGNSGHGWAVRGATGD